MITIEEQASVRQAYPEAEFVVFTPTSKVAHIVVSTGRMIPICGRDMHTSGYSVIIHLPDTSHSACKVCWRFVETRLPN